MEELISILHQGNYSCVIKNGDEIRTFTQRGVADLFDLIHNEPNFLKGAIIADKVVGKAAIALMLAGGVSHLYTDLISSKALELLENNNLKVTYQTEVPIIINRDKTDWCPLEKLCMEERSVPNILNIITNFINQIRAK